VGRFLTVTYTWARRCTIALIGGTIVLIGVLMIVFPGPAFIVIPAGLAILGIEFACARRWLKQLRTTGTQVINRTGRWLRPWRRSSRQAEPVRRFPGTAHRSAAAADQVKANTKTGY
jgi:tellurite resistance protein TerC